MYLCLSVCLPTRLSVCLSVSLSVCLAGRAVSLLDVVRADGAHASMTGVGLEDRLLEQAYALLSGGVFGGEFIAAYDAALAVGADVVLGDERWVGRRWCQTSPIWCAQILNVCMPGQA
jgi:hypothetical protein